MKFFAVFAAIVAVAIARPSTTSWTLEELSEALQNPQINPEIKPILEQALNEFMDALFAGQQLESIQVPLPVDVTLFPSPVAPSPVIPAPVAPAPTGAPLVQLIINVKGQPQQVADIVAPSPAAPEVMPTPVQVVDTPFEIINPGPAIVDEIAPTPVVVAPVPVNPVDIIAVNPVESWGPDGLMPAIDSGDIGPM